MVQTKPFNGVCESDGFAFASQKLCWLRNLSQFSKGSENVEQGAN